MTTLSLAFITRSLNQILSPLSQIFSAATVILS